MEKNNTIKKVLQGLFIIGLFLLLPKTLHAATLQMKPSTSSYAVGDTIRMQMTVSSPSQSINGVSATMHYSNNLSLTSLSKSGSILNLWAQEPSYSNATHSARFEGVMLNGYTGIGGPVITAVFKIVKPGQATVNITNATVLANDGEGTNVLSASSPAVISITDIPIKSTPENTVTPPLNEASGKNAYINIEQIREIDNRNPQTKFLVTMKNSVLNQQYTVEIDGLESIMWTSDKTNTFVTPPMTPGVHVIKFTAIDSNKKTISSSVEFITKGVTKPTFTDFSTKLLSGDYIVVKGIADPQTTVAITQTYYSQNTSEQKNIENMIRPQVVYIITNSQGQFTYVSDVKSAAGKYSITAKARTVEGFESDTTPALNLLVENDSLTRLSTILTKSLSLIIPIIALVILLILLVLYGIYYYKRFTKKIRKDITEGETIINEKFAIIDEDIEEYAKILFKLKTTSSLTASERQALVQLKKDITIAQRAVLKNLKDAENDIKI